MKRLLLAAVTAALIAAPAFAAPQPQDLILGKWRGFYFCKQTEPQPVAITVIAVPGPEDEPPAFFAHFAHFPGHPDGFTLTATYETSRTPSFLPPSLRGSFPVRGMWHFTPQADPAAPHFTVTVSDSGQMLYGHPPGRKCGPYKHGFLAQRTPAEF